MGKTFDNLPAKQAEVFEQIAVGMDGGHHPKTLASLQSKGYIEPYQEVKGRDGFGLITVTRYEVPLDIHIRWCEWCSENYTEEEETQP